MTAARVSSLEIRRCSHHNAARMPRAAVVVVAVLAVALSWPARAMAHAELESTVPASGTVLKAAPHAVTLRFGEGVQIKLGAVRVLDGGGHRIDAGALYHPGGDDRLVAVKVKPGANGTYVVSWRVTSADGHVIDGA